MFFSRQILTDAMRRLRAAFTDPIISLPAAPGRLTAFYVAERSSDGLWYVAHPAHGVAAGPYSHEMALAIARQSNRDALAAHNAEIRRREEMSRHVAA